MVRLLVIIIALLSQAEASMQQQSSQDSSSTESSYVSSPKNTLSVRYEHIRDGADEMYRGLCLPYQAKSGQLIYHPHADFSSEVYESINQPAEIPDIITISGPKDIIKIARFFATYSNRHFTRPFMESKMVMNRVIYDHVDAFLDETNHLLDLVRPSQIGETDSVRGRLQNKIKIAMDCFFRSHYRLIKALFEKDKIDLYDISFSHFDSSHSYWKGIYAPNKEQIDAAMRFARMVYVDKPDIQAFATIEEFNAALMEIDPGFNDVLHEQQG